MASTVDSQKIAIDALLDARNQDCPDLATQIVDHFEATGASFECADFRLAVAVAMGQEETKEAQIREDEYRRAVMAALQEEAREQRALDAAVRAALIAEARERNATEYEGAIKRAIRNETAEAIRQGEALVDRSCGSQGGWYRYEISPVRVWLDSCNAVSGGRSDSGGDLDCEDIGEEFSIDPRDDPYNLDGDGDGIACEGW